MAISVFLCVLFANCFFTAKLKRNENKIATVHGWLSILGIEEYICNNNLKKSTRLGLSKQQI